MAREIIDVFSYSLADRGKYTILALDVTAMNLIVKFDNPNLPSFWVYIGNLVKSVFRDGVYVIDETAPIYAGKETLVTWARQDEPYQLSVRMNKWIPAGTLTVWNAQIDPPMPVLWEPGFGFETVNLRESSVANDLYWNRLNTGIPNGLVRLPFVPGFTGGTYQLYLTGYRYANTTIRYDFAVNNVVVASYTDNTGAAAPYQTPPSPAFSVPATAQCELRWIANGVSRGYINSVVLTPV